MGESCKLYNINVYLFFVFYFREHCKWLQLSSRRHEHCPKLHQEFRSLALADRAVSGRRDRSLEKGVPRFQPEQGVRMPASRDGQLHGVHGRGAESTASVQPPEHPKDRGLLLQQLPNV